MKNQSGTYDTVRAEHIFVISFSAAIESILYYLFVSLAPFLQGDKRRYFFEEVLISYGSFARLGSL